MGYTPLNKGLHRKRQCIALLLSLLGATAVFLCTLMYHIKKGQMKWAYFVKYPKMGVPVLTYTAIFTILGGAFLFTYFLYRKKYAYAQGVFWAVLAAGLLLWGVKQYIINYL